MTAILFPTTPTYSSDPTAMTVTLASLASSSSGVGRQTDLVAQTTTQHGAALISGLITVGTSPTAGSVIRAYLLRGDLDSTTPLRTDGAGTGDAAITIVNAPLLKTIVVPVATSDTGYPFLIDTWAAGVGILGPQWGVAFVNSTDVNLNSTGSNHSIRYRYYDPTF